MMDRAIGVVTSRASGDWHVLSGGLTEIGTHNPRVYRTTWPTLGGSNAGNDYGGRLMAAWLNR